MTPKNSPPLDVIAGGLGARTHGEVGGEPVTDVYTPEGLALLVRGALEQAGFLIVHPNDTHEHCPDWWTCCIHNPEGAYR